MGKNATIFRDDNYMTLDELRERFENTDLIPSHLPLLNDIEGRMAALKAEGIVSVAELRKRLKKAKSLAELAKISGLEADYLNLLRRAVEGFFPKPRLLSEFDWLDKKVVSKLEAANFKNTEELYLAAFSAKGAHLKKLEINRSDLEQAIALSDLSRIQWVSPVFARALISAGFTTASKVATANPEELCNAIEAANKDSRFYKGKIGLRDVKRLVKAASYLP